MKIIVNGQDREISGQISIGKFLDEAGFLRSRIAVELNGAIVPKKQYEEIVLHSGDVLEVVSFVGGG